MGKIADATFTGASGKQYDFEVYDLDTKFNNVGAVYTFTKRTVEGSKGTHTFLYIGQTDKLKDRIANHEKWSCVEKHGVTSICIHRDENETSRLNKETDLLDANSTPCND